MATPVESRKNREKGIGGETKHLGMGQRIISRYYAQTAAHPPEYPIGTD